MRETWWQCSDVVSVSVCVQVCGCIVCNLPLSLRVELSWSRVSKGWSCWREKLGEKSSVQWTKLVLCLVMPTTLKEVRFVCMRMRIWILPFFRAAECASDLLDLGLPCVRRWTTTGLGCRGAVGGGCYGLLFSRWFYLCSLWLCPCSAPTCICIIN